MQSARWMVRGSCWDAITGIFEQLQARNFCCTNTFALILWRNLHDSMALNVWHSVCFVIFLSKATKLIWLVVWTHLKNISQLGWLFPIYGKRKNVPNHQPVMDTRTMDSFHWTECPESIDFRSEGFYSRSAAQRCTSLQGTGRHCLGNAENSVRSYLCLQKA